jgi:hypothetical protein
MYFIDDYMMVVSEIKKIREECEKLSCIWIKDIFAHIKRRYRLMRKCKFLATFWQQKISKP